jgi:hypothetical protein
MLLLLKFSSVVDTLDEQELSVSITVNAPSSFSSVHDYNEYWLIESKSFLGKIGASYDFISSFDTEYIGFFN